MIKDEIFALLQLAATICATTITPKLFQQQAIAQGAPNLVQGELTAPSGSKPFGGERVGFYAIQPQAQMLSILVGLEKAPSAGKVFKAWLVDTKASSYLSLGEVSADGKLTFNQNIGKPHAYNQILISEESPNSSTPKPSQIIGGDALRAPFGT